MALLKDIVQQYVNADANYSWRELRARGAYAHRQAGRQASASQYLTSVPVFLARIYHAVEAIYIWKLL